ncbi:TOBE domain-containing protein [Streptomyces colonosanans]|uniref:Transport-associated OB type 1 domain-containing protein n=1 Tax=Streptomyces colonosanans TaxID=1428652 RepID=A0A1S2PL24_9ACTN|nr:hypothetical protein BIV24_11045 [Streptomyces colonosanans]
MEAGISLQNRLPGTVEDAATGEAMASVKVTIVGVALTAAITQDAAPTTSVRHQAPRPWP